MTWYSWLLIGFSIGILWVRLGQVAQMYWFKKWRVPFDESSAGLLIHVSGVIGPLNFLAGHIAQRSAKREIAKIENEQWPEEIDV